MRLHDLRHAVAGVLGKITDGKTASGLLRHTSVKTTFDLYRDKDLDEERKAIEEYSRIMQEHQDKS
jgi:integrase